MAGHYGWGLKALCVGVISATLVYHVILVLTGSRSTLKRLVDT